MGMSGPVLGAISFELEPDTLGTWLKLSHQIMGTLDDDVCQGHTTGWQELLGQHFRRWVEQGKGFREA
jgi:hypothetical protein